MRRSTFSPCPRTCHCLAYEGVLILNRLIGGRTSANDDLRTGFPTFATTLRMMKKIDTLPAALCWCWCCSMMQQHRAAAVQQFSIYALCWTADRWRNLRQVAERLSASPQPKKRLSQCPLKVRWAIQKGYLRLHERGVMLLQDEATAALPADLLESCKPRWRKLLDHQVYLLSTESVTLSLLSAYTGEWKHQEPAISSLKTGTRIL